MSLTTKCTGIDAPKPATIADDIARLTATSANPELSVICVTTTATRAALARAGQLHESVSTPVRRDHLRPAVAAACGKGNGPPQETPSAASAAVRPPDVGRADDCPAAPTTEVNSQTTGTTPARAPQPARRLLYVDDNPMMTRLVERIFAADPAVTVQTASDGVAGLDMATQHQPDIVLLDLNLSDMSGEALLRQLQDDPRTRSIPAVIVSGDAAPATIKRLCDLGAAAYLTKPFTSSRLRQLVDEIASPAGENG